MSCTRRLISDFELCNHIVLEAPIRRELLIEKRYEHARNLDKKIEYILNKNGIFQFFQYRYIVKVKIDGIIYKVGFEKSDKRFKNNIGYI